MSTNDNLGHEPGPSERATPLSKAAPQSRRRSLQSGFSLLARAEPQIWFTGGMLAICLAMVVSLLTLILVSGLPTFWPQPVDWLALRNGASDIGEAQTTAAGSRREIKSGSDLTAPAGASYYYRTENFDLTNTHYRWFESSDLNPSGIVRVPELTLIERFEWGHLYGLPLRIHEPLLASDSDGLRLDEIVEVEQSLQTMSTLQLVSGSATEANTKSATRARELLQSRMVELKNSALRRSIQSAGQQAGASADQPPVQFRVVGENTWRQHSELEDDMRLEAVRRVLVDRESVMARLKFLLPDIELQRKTLQRLKHEVSRLDVKISKLRIAVRQAELDTGSVLPLQLDAVHAQLEQQAGFKQRLARVTTARERLPELLDEAALTDSLTQQLTDYEQVLLPAELAAIERQLATWRKPLENSPVTIRDAVSNYEAGYGEVFLEKQPLQKRITDLQSQLDLGELMVGVPNGARSAGEVAEQDLQAASKGEITVKLAEQLKAVELDVAAGPATLIFAGKTLTLIRLRDQLAMNHILSIPASQDLADGAIRVALLTEHPVAFKELVRVLPVNQLTFSGKLAVYVSRWREFLFEDPREANTLGGVFPAIWGTVVMTLIMTVAVVPFGVMAALYLREYTSGGALVSIIRISINNLAGVPSIVYGVFGFSFFCMTIGSFIDGGPKGADIHVWPSSTWFLILWSTVAVGTAAFLFSLVSSGPAHTQTTFKRHCARAAFVLWIVSLIIAIALIAKSPFFDGFYAAELPNPTFGKGGLLWASLTLALLTLPVVIVATEEALSAVPNSLREGSLACGASKWQTIRRIVLPHARPGILTGAILAMARGAGEVAPLMLVGALPNAPELPLDGDFPYFHGSRNFMHLGYQIYSLGFQSQNSEAAKPMVFTCTLLLILIVASLNIVAIYLRARLRKRFQGNQF